MALSRVGASGIVDADREALFCFTDWCYNVPQWFPPVSKTRIINLPDSSGLGKVTHYDGNLMGRELEWEGSSAGWKENERWAMKATTGMPARMNMQLSLLFEAADGSGDNKKKTKVTCTIDYRVPYPLVGGLIDKFYFRREAQRLVNSAIEGIKQITNQDQLPSLESQLEKRKLDHPGYLPTPPSRR